MKCIYCDKDAEYVMDGVSVCEMHTDCISNWSIPSDKEWKKSPLYQRIKERG